MGEIFPHFYCDRCSNVYFNEKNRELIYKNNKSKELLEFIEKNLPHCCCDGKFTPYSGPKCPHCNHLLVQIVDPIARLDEPHAIVIDGAYLLIGTN